MGGKILTLTTLALMAGGIAFADDTKVASIVSKTTMEHGLTPVAVPMLNYKSAFDEDGRIVVRLDEAQADKSDSRGDIMTIYAPNARETERLFYSQDWYVALSPTGGMYGIYTVPKDMPLPSNVLRRLGEGHGLMKVSPKSSFFKVFPSKIELASHLATFSEATRDAVCSEKKRPESISTSVNVKPGWSASGRISFNATWKVSELCSDKK